MKFPGAPYGLKMACGENPKRVYGSQGALAVDAHGQRRRLPRVVDPRRAPTATSCERWRRRRAADPAKRRTRDLSSRRWPACCAARSWCRTTATAPTRWRRCSTWRTSSASRSPPSTTARGVQDRATCWRARASAATCGGLVGLQDGGLRRHPAERGAGATRRARCAIVHSDSAQGIQRLNQEAAKAMARRARPASASPTRTTRCAGSPSTRPGRSASTADRHARGGQDGRRGGLVAATRSASTAKPSRCTSTAR